MTPPIGFTEGTVRSGKLDRFEGKLAIVLLDDGQELPWPIAQLPAEAEIGQPIRLTLSTHATQTAEREAVAKVLLNQLLAT